MLAIGILLFSHDLFCERSDDLVREGRLSEADAENTSRVLLVFFT